MNACSALTQLTDAALHGEIKRLTGSANTLLGQLLAHLAEIAPLDDAAATGALARPRNRWAAYVRSLAGPVRQLEAGLGAGQAPPRKSEPATSDHERSAVDQPRDTGARTPALDVRPGSRTLRCRSHNDLAAEQDFGRDVIRERRAARQLGTSRASAVPGRPPCTQA
ncbi:MAG: hypothetical protein ABI895_20580 [Deltaproteobacteria bacterium]